MTCQPLTREEAAELQARYWPIEPTSIVRAESEDPTYTAKRAFEMKRGRSRAHFRKLCKQTPKLAAAIERAKINGNRLRSALENAKAGDIIGVEPGTFWSGR